MTQISYFKRQAKNLHKDYKAKAPYIDDLLVGYRFDKDDFCLMKAQHIVALMSGFDKWADLSKASEVELELAKLLFDNQDKIPIVHWNNYVAALERDLGITLDAKSRLEIFQHDNEVVFNGRTYNKPFSDHRINRALGIVTKNEKPRQAQKSRPDMQITSLPLNKEDRVEFIETANSVFENVMELMEAGNPELTRKLWDVEDYVDNLLIQDMLPISRDYALLLIEPFMVQLVAELAVQADKIAEQTNV
jgi:hypothetical protein